MSKITEEPGYQSGFTPAPTRLIESGLKQLGATALGLFIYLNNEWRNCRPLSQLVATAALGDGRSKIRAAWKVLEEQGFIRKVTKQGIVVWEFTVVAGDFSSISEEQNTDAPLVDEDHENETTKETPECEKQTDPSANIEQSYICSRCALDKTVSPYPQPTQQSPLPETGNSVGATANLADATAALGIATPLFHHHLQSTHFEGEGDCRPKKSEKTEGVENKGFKQRDISVLEEHEYIDFKKLLKLDKRSDNRSDKACKRLYAAALSEGISSEEIVIAYQQYVRDMQHKNGSNHSYTKTLYGWLKGEVSDKNTMRAYVERERIETAKHVAAEQANAARREKEQAQHVVKEKREAVIQSSPELQELQEKSRAEMRKLIHTKDQGQREVLQKHWDELCAEFEEKLTSAMSNTDTTTPRAALQIKAAGYRVLNIDFQKSEKGYFDPPQMQRKPKEKTAGPCSR